MRRLHFVFNLVFQSFFFFLHQSGGIVFADIPLVLFLGGGQEEGVHFRVSGAARCALEFILVALTFLVEEPSDQTKH